MPDGAALALQAALITAMEASVEVTALVDDRIYDEPPDSPQLPYIRLGAIEPLPARTTCGNGKRILFGIEAHSRPNSGRVEATRICEALEVLFDGNPASLSLSGHRVSSLDYQTQTTGRENDGKTYLGIIAFQAMIQPE